ncbi:cation transporting ATPase C-terminal domain-containing protein [Embleya sp. NPDC020630]|uniref:cation transporting ATPase C-terminal domain-containing protein n=1 Tax=Embleya sp. NPDC020630 TaxID=3363979 RepID=UPI0037B8976A
MIRRDLLVRAWLFLGPIAAALVLSAFFAVLVHGGWRPGDPTGSGTALHHTYIQATTATFMGIVACQIGTAFAARTEHAPLRAVVIGTNPLLLWGIVFEIAFTAALVYLPPLQQVFDTAAPPIEAVGIIAVFPLVMWGADELRRAYLRRS